MRAGIDALDQEIIKLIAKRFALTRQVGQEKLNSNINPLDVSREEFIMEKWAKLAADADVDPQLARSLIRLIITQVVTEHNAIR